MTKTNAELSNEVEALATQVAGLAELVKNWPAPVNVSEITAKLENLNSGISSLSTVVGDNAKELNELTETVKANTADIAMLQDKGDSVDFFAAAGPAAAADENAHLMSWLKVVLGKYHVNDMPPLPVVAVDAE